MHCRHISSSSVTDHPIFHIVTDYVFDLCFEFIVPSIITFAFYACLQNPVSCSIWILVLCI